MIYMLCELINLVHNEYLNSAKLLQTGNTENNLSYKFHAAIIQNKTFILTTPRTRLKFYRTNYNTYEAQSFSEHASYAYEHPKIFLEFI